MLPPIVPTWRVAGEPTIDRGVGKGREPLADAGVVGQLGVRGERAEPQAPIARRANAAKLGDAVDRHQLIGDRPLALPRTHHEIRPAGDGASARGQGLEHRVHRVRRDVGCGRRCPGRPGPPPPSRSSPPPGSPTRLGMGTLAAAGRDRRSPERWRWRSLPASGCTAASPRPLSPSGRRPADGLSVNSTTICGASAAVWSL